jgi:hypothetical protein
MGVTEDLSLVFIVHGQARNRFKPGGGATVGIVAVADNVWMHVRAPHGRVTFGLGRLGRLRSRSGRLDGCFFRQPQRQASAA